MGDAPFYIREALEGDLDPLLDLYSHLNSPKPEIDDKIKSLWLRILSDESHYILLAICGDKPVATCVIQVIENLTRGQRPYALIENVVTHPDYRKKGCATAVLSRAREIAAQAGCYKIMLMTGSKEESTLNFYKKAGYNCEDKTAFIQWIK